MPEAITTIKMRNISITLQSFFLPLYYLSVLPPCAPNSQATTDSLLFQIGFHFLGLYTYGIIQYVFCFVWLLLLSIVILRIKLSTLLCVQFILLLRDISLYVNTTIVYPFKCWWTFVLFLVGAIINKATMNICVLIFI